MQNLIIILAITLIYCVTVFIDIRRHIKSDSFYFEFVSFSKFAWSAMSAKDKRLLFLIAGSCAVLELVYRTNMDIALYYAVGAMVSIVTAVIAITAIKSVSSKVLVIFLSVQSVVCLCLVPDWPFTGNEWLQFKLSEFNAILTLILIGLGITGSDNILRRNLCAG